MSHVSKIKVKQSIWIYSRFLVCFLPPEMIDSHIKNDVKEWFFCMGIRITSWMIDDIV